MIEEKSIVNGKNRLIYSKRVVLASDDPITFCFVMDNAFDVEFDFSFETTEDKKPNVNFRSHPVDGGFKVEVVAQNFNNSMGTGFIDPVVFLERTDDATKITKKLSFAFFAYKNDNAHHIMDFDIYEEI